MGVFVIIVTCFTILNSSCSKAPKVPHAINNRSDDSCLVCHRNGENNAPKMTHKTSSDCLSCH